MSVQVIFCVVDVLAGIAMYRTLVVLKTCSSSALRAVGWGWLLNPIVINISTRGSADAIPSALSLLALLGAVEFAKIPEINSGIGFSSRPTTLQCEAPRVKRTWQQWSWLFFGGVSHGLAIHVKLYPVIYLPAFAFFFVASSSPSYRTLLHLPVEVS